MGFSSFSVLWRPCCTQYPLLAAKTKTTFFIKPNLQVALFAMDDTARTLEVLKEQLISSHEESRRMMTGRSVRISLTRCEPFDIRPSRPRTSLNELSPIHCQSLVLNTVHTGRVLRGVLVAQPFVVNAAHTIIEDEAGGLAFVSFYNFALSPRDHTQLTYIAESLFRKGKKVAIHEPFYKLGRDGTYIIRVENFAEHVTFPYQLGPCCSERWRGEGKAHFTRKEFREAIYCYRRSIDTHDKHKLSAILLSNIATCLLLKELYRPSLLLAVASIIVDSSLFRPLYTAGLCLNRLNRKDLSFNCLEECRKLNAPLKFCIQLQEVIGETRKSHIPASEWNAKVLSLVASAHVHDLLQIDSNDAVESELLKEEGNKMFKKQQYDEAIREYCTALRGMPEVASLLTNRSICYAKNENHPEAALHASAAILIAPNSAKAHFWKSSSLLQLTLKREAEKSLDAAVELVGSNADLVELRKRIKFMYMASSENEPSEQSEKGPYLQEQETQTERKQEEEMFQRGAIHGMPASIVSFLENKMRPLTGLAGRRNQDDVVEPFHLEFSRRDEWPAGCDRQSGMILLTNAFESARAPDPLREISLETLSASDMARLSKRLHSTDEEVHKWWFTAPCQSLSPRMRNPCSSRIHQSFTNSPCVSNVLLFGTVHVSIAFVDLSDLLFSKLMPSARGIGPLRWIGYERSAYSVAKFMVIAHMMRRQADTDCILQVWFSSSWSKKTLHMFRMALNELIRTKKRTNATTISTEVVFLWKHWQRVNVTLREARSTWLSRHICSSQLEIANFQRRMDRLALCRYVISGEILEGEVGSIVMFGSPSTARGDQYEIASNEWFLHCLPIHDIVEEVDEKTNVIDAAIHILQKHISELKKLVSDGTVVIEMHHQQVKLSEKCVLREIRKLSPHSISWSNMCDYCSNDEFHKMARACSRNNTWHYVNSMNWCAEVKGAFLMDYTNQEQIMEEAKSAIVRWYQLSGLSNYLHAPPITHHENIGSNFLCRMMREVWTENFFNAASLTDTERQTAIEPSTYDVLARAPNTVHMWYTFSKDKEVIVSYVR